jgi:hypothetical protein
VEGEGVCSGLTAPGLFTVHCEDCGKAYRIRRPRRRHPHRRCNTCRGRAGLAARKAVFHTPDSTKAERIRANGLVNMRQKRGTFKKPKTCMKCGRKPSRIDSHHPDYSKPAEVVFLCRSCHMKAHHDAAFLDGMTPFLVPVSLPAPSADRGHQ